MESQEQQAPWKGTDFKASEKKASAQPKEKMEEKKTSLDENWPALSEVTDGANESQQTQNSNKKSGIKSVQAAGKTSSLPDTPASPEVGGPQSAPSTQSSGTAASQSDSGGDDSAKENKENSSDENRQTPKAKKGSRQIWKPLHIDPPPKGHRGRRSHSAGRRQSPPPHRRDPRRAGERVMREQAEARGQGDKKGTDQGANHASPHSDSHARGGFSHHGVRRGRGRGGRGGGGRGGRGGKQFDGRGPDRGFGGAAGGGFDGFAYFKPPPVFPPTMGTTYYNTVVPDEESLRQFLINQLEYYFSDGNLEKDFFLRRKMDEEGWVSIRLIATFNRMKNLTLDLQAIKEAIKQSKGLEISENEELVRGRNKPEKWPLRGEENVGLPQNIHNSILRVDVPDFVPGQRYFTSGLERAPPCPALSCTPFAATASVALDSPTNSPRSDFSPSQSVLDPLASPFIPSFDPEPVDHCPVEVQSTSPAPTQDDVDIGLWESETSLNPLAPPFSPSRSSSDEAIPVPHCPVEAQPASPASAQG